MENHGTYYILVQSSLTDVGSWDENVPSLPVTYVVFECFRILTVFLYDIGPLVLVTMVFVDLTHLLPLGRILRSNTCRIYTKEYNLASSNEIHLLCS